MSLHAEIREKTKAELNKRGVPLHPHLPLRDECVERPASQVASQIVVLYALAGLTQGAEPRMLVDWLVGEQVWESMADVDQRFFDGSAISDENLNELSWKQESLFLLCWAGRIAGSVPYPDRECDLEPVFKSIPPEVAYSDFCRSFVLRDEDDIIAQLDLYYCLHAALRHPELWGEAPPEDHVKYPVVLERRRALEWLCCQGTPWNDVTLDT